MAAVMTSRQRSGAPPLPSRGNSGSGHDTHVSMTRATGHAHNQSNHGHHVGRTQSGDAPPPVPPMNRKGTEGAVHHHANNPPLPARNSLHGIQRRAFETNSFIDRHTAKAYSQGSSNDDAFPPPPPSITSLPSQHRQPVSSSGSSHRNPSTSSTASTSSSSSRTKYNDVFEVDDSAPPPPPVSRPPKVSSNRSLPEVPTTPTHQPVSSKKKRSASSVGDLETRFMFHGANDFPQPDEFLNIRKRYPSTPTGGRDAPGIPMGSFYHKDPSTIGYL